MQQFIRLNPSIQVNPAPSIVCAMLIVLGTLLLAACDSSSGERETESKLAEGLSAIEVRDKVVKAMRRPDHVYHRIDSRDQEAGQFSNTGQFEFWLESNGRRVRKEYEMVLSNAESETLKGVEIVADTELFKFYVPDGGDRSRYEFAIGIGGCRNLPWA